MPVSTHAWGSNFDELADQVRAMMSEMEGRNWFRSHAPDTWCPRVNLYETTDRYVICVELAGMQRKEIDLRAVDGVLYIRGARSRPVIPGDATDVGVHLMEIDSGRFQRKLPLPSDVIAEQISATYCQGYLWIMLPRGAVSESTDS